MFWLMRGHLTEARRLLEKALEMSRASPASVRSKALNGAGWMALQQGDHESACKFYEESLHVGRAGADKRVMAIANRGLGTVARVKGNFTAAGRYYKQSLEIGKQIRDQKAVAESLTSQGELARTEENYPAARALYEKALTLSKRIGNWETVCANLINLGAVAYHEQDFAAAHAYYGQALAVSQEDGHRLWLFVILHGFAALAMKRGNLNRACLLSGAAEGLRESIGYELDHTPDRSLHDHYVSELRAALGEPGFSKTVADGRDMKVKQVIPLALEMIRNGWAREVDEPRSHQQPVKSRFAASEP
jgi:tetratricopeptide (TPR) repeat protein